MCTISGLVGGFRHILISLGSVETTNQWSSYPSDQHGDAQAQRQMKLRDEERKGAMSLHSPRAPEPVLSSAVGDSVLAAVRRLRPQRGVYLRGDVRAVAQQVEGAPEPSIAIIEGHHVWYTIAMAP